MKFLKELNEEFRLFDITPDGIEEIDLKDLISHMDDMKNGADDEDMPPSDDVEASEMDADDDYGHDIKSNLASSHSDDDKEVDMDEPTDGEEDTDDSTGLDFGKAYDPDGDMDDADDIDDETEFDPDDVKKDVNMDDEDDLPSFDVDTDELPDDMATDKLPADTDSEDGDGSEVDDFFANNDDGEEDDMDIDDETDTEQPALDSEEDDDLDADADDVEGSDDLDSLDDTDGEEDSKHDPDHDDFDIESYLSKYASPTDGGLGDEDDEDDEESLDDESGTDDELDDEGSDDMDDMDDMGDEDDLGDDEDSDSDNNYQGTIRTVKGAYLVYKRQEPDGTFSELWIYTVGDDMKKESTVRRAILAGTDIDPANETAKNNPDQYCETTSVGNVQYVKVVGLQS